MKKTRAKSAVLPVLVLLGYLVLAQGVLVNHVRLLLPKRHRAAGVRYEMRFQALRPLLPDRGIVGYASDRGREDFLRAQYVLAPLVLDQAGHHALIVANFSRDRARPDTINGRPYRILANLHNGVALLSPQPPWSSSASILLLLSR